MHFAILNFTFSIVVGIVGIMTLRRVSTPNELVFASLPLLFALHEFTQGFVWLGVYGLIEARALEIAESIYIFYAYGLLPFIIPLAIWLIEPKGRRRDLIALLMMMGALLSVYTMWGFSVKHATVSIKDGFLYYLNPMTDYVWVAVLYILTTGGSLILSRNITIQLFGWLNILGINLIYWFQPDALTSIWCLYAAIVSMVLYLYFVKRRIAFLEMLKSNEELWGSQFENELEKLLTSHPRFISR